MPLGAVGRNKPAVYLDTLSITPFILTNRRTVLPVLLLAATISHAHVGGVVYPIFELPPSQLPDVHDGSLAEWMVPNASLTKDDFLRESFVRHPDEFSFNVYMALSAAEQRIPGSDEGPCRLGDPRHVPGGGDGERRRHEELHHHAATVRCAAADR